MSRTRQSNRSAFSVKGMRLFPGLNRKSNKPQPPQQITPPWQQTRTTPPPQSAATVPAATVSQPRTLPPNLTATPAPVTPTPKTSDLSQERRTPTQPQPRQTGGTRVATTRQSNDGQNRQDDSLTNLALQTRAITEISPFFDYAMEGIDPETLPPEADPKELTGSYTEPARNHITLQWMASNLYHRPLYFEDAPLERYGHTYHPLVQPFASAGKFSLQLIGLPYQMACDPVGKCVYSLGWYRPGECAPKLHYQIPFNKKAAAVQAAAVTGAFFIFP